MNQALLTGVNAVALCPDGLGSDFAPAPAESIKRPRATDKTEFIDRFVREAECEKVSGLSRSTRWRLERLGLFPKRKRLGATSVGWLASELAEWLRSRPSATA